MFPQSLLQVVKALKRAGGQPYLVGGSVRDMALNVEPKDLDLEVYGLPVQAILDTVRPFGRVDQVGAQFGVIILKMGDDDFDIAVPRRESKSGRGHKGFIAEPDPTMTPEEAASRRDYTINALMYDFEKDEILDYFGGMDDINAGILRHIGPAFSEDPLRVLRGFQFASRFIMDVDPETAILCQGLFSEYDTLPLSRIWNEWLKWALKARQPSKGLKFLVETGWIEAYPEIKDLIGCPQDPTWHPEGDVFIHTGFVTDAAAEIANREKIWGDYLEKHKPPHERQGYDRALLLLSSLCHDYGKPIDTVWTPDRHETPGTERWRSPGHGATGVPLANDFLARIGCPISIIERAGPLIKHHLDYINGAARKTVRKLSANIVPANIQQLLWLIEADHSGRPPLPKKLPEMAQKIALVAEELAIQDGKPKKILTGRLLISEGIMEGGPPMGPVIAAAYEAQLEGDFDSEEGALRWAEDYLS
jgi:tRNA nucleotidyltransferase (CCA-adding enzyme)